MRRFICLVAAIMIIGLGRFAAGQLQSPPDYREKMRNMFQAPPQAVWVNVPASGSLPEGVTHHTYFSKSMGHDVGYCIYRPPQYNIEPQRRFPVIYHLHGINGTELARVGNAKVLHEGIVTGKWPPIIIVFANGGNATFWMDSADGKFMSETTVIKELIPHIDQTYRTIAERKGRCIEGHSMGGLGSTRLAIKYPQMFCSLFNQAGNIMRLTELYDAAHPERFPNRALGPDKARYIENDVFQLTQKNRDEIRDGLRIMILCGTKDSTHIYTIRQFHQALMELEIDHTYIEAEGLAHDQTKLIELYRPIWFDYHVESLRRAAEQTD